MPPTAAPAQQGFNRVKGRGITPTLILPLKGEEIFVSLDEL